MPGRARSSGICRRPCPPRAPPTPGPSGPAATAPSPLATRPRLNAAPFAPTDLRFPINLATALRLSDARPLIVAAAQARVWVAEAELTRAKVLWIPDAQHRLRLHPPRRRRPGLQQGHHDRPEHELLLRRCRPVGIALGDHLHDRCHLRAAGGPAGPERPALGHPDGEERRPAPDRRRLLPGAPVPRHLRRHPLHRRAGARRGRADRRPEPRPGPGVRGRPGAEHARRPRAAGRRGAAAVAGAERPADEGAAARPPRGGRAAGARPRPDHPDRPGPGARRPDADRADQPPRARLAPGAGRGGGGGGPPREGAPVHPQRRAQRLPDPLRDAPGRDLRPGPQQQPQPVEGP